MVKIYPGKFIQAYAVNFHLVHMSRFFKPSTLRSQLMAAIVYGALVRLGIMSNPEFGNCLRKYLYKYAWCLIAATHNKHCYWHSHQKSRPYDPAICLDIKNTFKFSLSKDKKTFSLKVL